MCVCVCVCVHMRTPTPPTHNQVSKTRIESMLALALVAAAPADTERENMSCALLSSSALDEVLYVISIDGTERGGGSNQTGTAGAAGSSQGTSQHGAGLSGHEAFTLTYQVEWPLNIVFSRKTMTKYRWLFRHLFLYKLAERDLCSAWGSHQHTKALKTQPVLALDFALRARMLHFVQSLQHYLVMHVIENCWHTFQEGLRGVKTVEDVLNVHDKCLDTCIKLFVLNDPNLLKMLSRAVTTCRGFAKYIEGKTALVLVGGQAAGGATREGLLGEEYAGVETIRAKRLARMQQGELAQAFSRDPRHRQTVDKYEAEFDHQVSLLLESLRTFCKGGGDPHLLALCAQLDFNNFYSYGRREAS